MEKDDILENLLSECGGHHAISLNLDSKVDVTSAHLDECLKKAACALSRARTSNNDRDYESS